MPPFPPQGALYLTLLSRHGHPQRNCTGYSREERNTTSDCEG
ncbi:MAG: hypothetical protein WBI82_05735 [Sphaerochaeta sp.]